MQTDLFHSQTSIPGRIGFCDSQKEAILIKLELSFTQKAQLLLWDNISTTYEWLCSFVHFGSYLNIFYQYSFLPAWMGRSMKGEMYILRFTLFLFPVWFCYCIVYCSAYFVQCVLSMLLSIVLICFWNCLDFIVSSKTRQCCNTDWIFQK